MDRQTTQFFIASAPVVQIVQVLQPVLQFAMVPTGTMMWSAVPALSFQLPIRVVSPAQLPVLVRVASPVHWPVRVPSCHDQLGFSSNPSLGK